MVMWTRNRNILNYTIKGSYIQEGMFEANQEM